LTISTLINSISEIGTTKFTLDRLENEEESINREILTSKQSLIDVKDKLKLIEEECLRYQDIISNLKSDKQISENDYSNQRRMFIEKLKELLDSITKIKSLINEKSNIHLVQVKEKDKLEHDIEELLNAQERILSDFNQKIAFVNGVALNYTGMIKKLLN
jgi:DNA-directed RNA polymerase beta' subunit